MKNKKLISNMLVWSGALLVITHAIYKLWQADWSDWQHWAVLIAGIIIVIGNIIRSV